ncbi:MAG: T9SS type A sorting domain-containing protein [Bacteroidetes bacterium]|nr:MAG: T9SS type A sorting domain-containing protein [Bacteroidota bacterium]
MEINANDRMIKLGSILLFLISLAEFGIGQDFLTRRQVWDFEVGDIIQYEYHHKNFGGPSYTFTTYFTKEILDKHWSIGQDTVIYQISTLEYHLKSYPEDSASVKESIEDLIITNLDVKARSYDNALILDSCDHLRDTMMVDEEFCQLPMWMIDDNVIYEDFDYVMNCFEDDFSQWWYYPGLGGWYYNHYDAHYWDRGNSLVYFKKGEEECGFYVNYPPELGLKKLSAFKGPRILQNPAQEYLSFTDMQGNYSYKIINSNGQCLLQGQTENQRINLSKIDPGCYFVELNLDFENLWRKVFFKM